MSLLNLPTVENATGDVKKIFDEIQSIFGMVPNGIRQWSINPRALQAQWNSIKIVLSKDPEDQKLYTMIRYLVSDENSCTYCTGMNAAALINMFEVSQDELVQLQKDPASANLNEKHKAMLLFAIQSVKDADSVTDKDVEKLKFLGATEIEIFDVVHAASNMLVINTLFKTFKVQKD